MNYAGCTECGGKDIKIDNRIVTEDEDELVTYQREY
jgi:hypothetical protein